MWVPVIVFVLLYDSDSLPKNKRSVLILLDLDSPVNTAEGNCVTLGLGQKNVLGFHPVLFFETFVIQFTHHAEEAQMSSCRVHMENTTGTGTETINQESTSAARLRKGENLQLTSALGSQPYQPSLRGTE